jgi:imidazolonepropionase-like amidohydrolase
MRGISLFCSLGISLTLVIGASTDADAQTTALRGARVIDGRGGAPIDNATIVIRGGRIVAIGSSSGTPIPNGAEVVNYTGKTIIPGLISGHSHIGIFVGLKAAPENYNRMPSCGS